MNCVRNPPKIIEKFLVNEKPNWYSEMQPMLSTLQDIS